jgi:hypothetical protein
VKLFGKLLLTVVALVLIALVDPPTVAAGVAMLLATWGGKDK